MTEYRWFHSHGKVIGFTASNGQEIPDLLSGDNYLMPQLDAEKLEAAGAGHIRREPVKDVAQWQRASDLSPLTNGMEYETELINKLDREDEC